MMALLATTAAATFLGACGHTSGGLFSREPAEVQMSATEAARATSQWAVAYAKDPKDSKKALGYARSLKAIGSKERSFEILKMAYGANPNDGEVAAELGRVALDIGQLDVARSALKSAEAQGFTDWRTLSALGTLHSKKGENAEAQQYYLAALEKKPDAVPVINNLALSYALDGNAQKAEALLRRASADGASDKRIRQNLALVLGVQGKFDEAREMASVDMTEDQTKSSVAYMRNMISESKKVATASVEDSESVSDWAPFSSNVPVKAESSTQKISELNSTPKPARAKPPNTQTVEPRTTARVAKAEPVKPVKPTVGDTRETGPNTSVAAPTKNIPEKMFRAGL
jgi:Flp pilus assembly protein TadD